MSDAILRDRRREADNARLNVAFGAWLQGAGGDKSWSKFCQHYGLLPAKTPQNAPPTKIADKTDGGIYAWAENVVGIVKPKNVKEQ
jgi:hypothetical protein